MKITLIVLTIFLTAMTIFSQTMPPLEAGVSQALAKWRGRHYSDVRYKLNITLEKGAPLMKGTIEISVKLTDEAAKNGLILDWRTTQFANDKDKPFADVVQVNESVIKKLPDSGNYAYLIDKEHIVIAPRLLKTGENVIKIEFASPIKTSGAAITRYVDKEDGAEYIYSLFVPSDASTAFPVFDQPDLKARFQLNVIAPKEWNIVSNTIGEENVSFKEQGVGFNGAKNYVAEQVVSFEETKPISTYVFAFAAGDFRIFIDEQSMKSFNKNATTEFRLFVRKSQLKKADAIAKEVFRLDREGVKFLESYFDYKFPFPKYDLVLIPEFPFGGMEHAGATFLRESSVIFPTEPTKNDLVSRANVIFHEAAHQWFGDTVTMKWFDDLWLKEGFAEFMAYKTLEKVMPEYNAWKIFYERNKQAAYLTDSTKGTTPIYQEIPNLSAAKSAYGNIVYRKAPSFLKQAEFYLGKDKFQTAVRAFLKKHEFANAEWTDLVKEFELTSKLDLKDWGNVWVKQRGTPIIKTKDCDVNTQDCKTMDFYAVLYSLNQKGSIIETDNWQQSINILIADFNGKRSVNKTKLGDYDDYSKNKNTTHFNAYQDYKLPQFVFPNYQDYGYGIFLLDEKSRAYVLANIQTEKDDFLRAMMWGALWDSVREGELNPKDYVELVIKNINVETDESTINTILGRVSTAMNYYLPDAQRDELAPKVEAVLIDKMQNALTLGQRITFYRAFLNIASSDKARIVLKEIFNNDFGFGGGDTKMRAGVKEVNGKMIYAANPAIPLKTKDRFDIVTRLLILGDAAAPKMLAELEQRESSDEAKRYAYAAKAGIGTAGNKQKFWNDFTGNRDISESYVESAFVAFNSSKQADLSLPYLEKALTELPNLKRTRKIFFINGWLSAFIGGQKSEQALAIVNKFLAGNPTLDKDLRLKILENADGLERAVRIRAKYGN